MSIDWLRPWVIRYMKINHKAIPEIIIHLTHANVWSQVISFTISHKRICNNTTSLARIYQCHKSHVLRLNVQWNRRVIWLSQQYQAISVPEKSTRVLPLALLLVLCTNSNTDGNKQTSSNHSSKLWHYTRTWTKSRRWALFCETTVYKYSGTPS